MSVNSSSNTSLQPPPEDCFSSRVSWITYIALFIIVTLLLPLFIYVLYVGYQRWRRRRSVATAAMTSHSDIFTYNMVTLELISFLGSCFYIYGSYTHRLTLTMVGLYIFSIISPGQTLFHLITCVERYLAVVHPITYLRLSKGGGVWIRDVSTVCVWLLCFLFTGLKNVNVKFGLFLSFFLTALSLTVVSFCSFSVLCVLIRPGPGEVGGNRGWVDQSKRRAFHTIMVITGALLLKFSSSLVNAVMYVSPTISLSGRCLALFILLWFSLPSSLVLPLLFLQRAGKLPGCKGKHFASEGNGI